MNPEPLTIAAAGINALTTFVTATLVMLVYAFRSKEDKFDLIGWAVDNRNRFMVGALLIVLFSGLTVLTPDITAILSVIGFNVDGQVPVSFGLALAAFLLGGVSTNSND